MRGEEHGMDKKYKNYKEKRWLKCQKKYF